MPELLVSSKPGETWAICGTKAENNTRKSARSIEQQAYDALPVLAGLMRTCQKQIDVAFTVRHAQITFRPGLSYIETPTRLQNQVHRNGPNRNAPRGAIAAGPVSRYIY